jgi:hypothetical protein
LILSNITVIRKEEFSENPLFRVLNEAFIFFEKRLLQIAENGFLKLCKLKLGLESHQNSRLSPFFLSKNCLLRLEQADLFIGNFLTQEKGKIYS